MIVPYIRSVSRVQFVALPVALVLFACYLLISQPKGESRPAVNETGGRPVAPTRLDGSSDASNAQLIPDRYSHDFGDVTPGEKS
jgi:hypothetical protein